MAAPEDDQVYVAIPWEAMELMLTNLYEIVECLHRAVAEMDEDLDHPILRLVPKKPDPEQGH